MFAAISKALGSIDGIVNKFVPDKTEQLKMKAALETEIYNVIKAEINARSTIIQAEATGQSWLQRNWRPITMLVFVGLVVARWLGFSAQGISHEVELKLLSIIQVGLGGYVVGRSAEKVAKVWKEK